MARLDKGILLVLLALIGVGLVQVYSSSYIFAIESRGDGLFFFKRQLLFSGLGIVALLATALAPYKWIERYGWTLWVLATLGVIATFVPGLAITKGGAVRWLNLPGGWVFEPSELLKISLSIFLATLISRPLESFGRWVWPARVAFVMLPLLAVLKQPDFGSFMICLLVTLSILFVFGLNWRLIVASSLAAIPAFYFLVVRVPYRWARVAAFLDPWADPERKGFQVIQSMLSFQSGGLTGVGLGQGQGKLFFLPEAHTDFTLAVMGEELGFIGFFIVLSMYSYLALRGLQMATRTEDRFAKAASLGLTLTFAFSTFINMGVVMGLLPTKGLTLPFLSYGGSSLLMTCFLFGLLLNIESHERLSLPLGQRASRLFSFSSRVHRKMER